MTPPIPLKPRNPVPNKSTAVKKPKPLPSYGDLKDPNKSKDTFIAPGHSRAKDPPAKAKEVDYSPLGLSDNQVFGDKAPQYQGERYKKYLKVTLALGAVKRFLTNDGASLFAKQRIEEWIGDEDLLQDPVNREAHRNLLGALEKASSRPGQEASVKSLLELLRSAKIPAAPLAKNSTNSSPAKVEEVRGTVPKPRPVVAPPPNAPVIPAPPPVSPKPAPAKSEPPPKAEAPKAPLKAEAPPPPKAAPVPVAPVAVPKGKESSLKESYIFKFTGATSLARQDTPASVNARLNPVLKPSYQKLLKRYEDLTVRCKLSIGINNNTGDIVSVEFSDLKISGSAGAGDIERMFQEMADRVRSSFKIEKNGDEKDIVFVAKLNFVAS